MIRPKPDRSRTYPFPKSSKRFQLRLLALEDRITPVLYDVGYKLEYPDLGSVPWNRLTAGDTVQIHWRSAVQGGDYHEKINISGQGTATNPIRVIGIPGPNGEKPVINGEKATTGADNTTSYIPTQTRGLLTFTRSDFIAQDFNFYKPMHVIVDGLVIRGAHPGNTFQDSEGSIVSYSDIAAGIYIERGSNITIRNCEITDSGNGFFAGSNDYAANGGDGTMIRDVLFEYNYVHGNGTVNGDREHNIYTEGVSFTFQYNRLDPLRTNAWGANLKDRSAGTIIRYNYIYGGGHLIDLVDAQESAGVTTLLPSYRHTYVYGNILRKEAGVSGSLIHYGGDDGLFQNYRKGTLHFYNNTVIVQENQSGENSAWRTYMFQISTSEETADVRNNIFYTSAAVGSPEGTSPTEFTFAATGDDSGTYVFGVNWVSPGWVGWRDNETPSIGSMTGTDNFIGNALNDPGFVNLMTDDLHLSSQSQAVDAGQALDVISATTNPPVMEYVYHQAGTNRIVSGAASDLGAYELVALGGTVQIRKGVASVDESAGTVTLLVTRTGSYIGPITLQYVTSSGTASSPDDYTFTTGTISWTHGNSRSQRIVIPIIDDALAEGNETFFVTISNPTGGAALGAITKATITILANDADGFWIERLPQKQLRAQPLLPIPPAVISGSFAIADQGRLSGQMLRRLPLVFLAPVENATVASVPTAPASKMVDSILPQVSAWTFGAEDLKQSETPVATVLSTIAGKSARTNPVDLTAGLSLLDGVFVG